MKISKKSLRKLVIVMVVVWLGAGAFFVLTSITAKPVETTLAGIEKFSRNDLKHCLLLEKDQVIYIHEDEKIKISYVGLSQELEKRKKLLQQKKINIICTKEASYQQIVSVLTMVSEKNISSYQLLKI